MRRLANGTQVSSLPVPAAAVGTPGFGTNGNPAAGQEASIFDADQYNRIQEEIVAPILAAGLALDGSNNAQLLAALRLLFARRQAATVVRLTPGVTSWTVPADVYVIRGRTWGGGGSGGAGTGGGGGGGGAAGVYAEGIFAVTPGQTLILTVGAGGVGSAGAGNAGGTTSIGSLMSVPGGAGGNPSANSSTPGTGAPPTTGGSGGLVGMGGSGGQDGYSVPAGPAGGMGGGSPGGGAPTYSPFASGAIPGNFPGGGSSGGASVVSAAGAGGLILIDY